MFAAALPPISQPKSLARSIFDVKKRIKHNQGPVYNQDWCIPHLPFHFKRLVSRQNPDKILSFTLMLKLQHKELATAGYLSFEMDDSYLR